MTLLGYERRLSKGDRERIARTLLLRDGVHLADMLAEIETVTQMYWGEFEHEKKRQSRKEIANEVTNVARCANALMVALYCVEPEGRYLLTARLQREFDRRSAALKMWLGEKEFDILKGLRMEQFVYCIECLASAAGKFDPRGRPREIALSVYAYHLALIYKNATGTQPKRRYNNYRQRQGEPEQLPFFAACMRAAGVPKYPSRIIRHALERL